MTGKIKRLLLLNLPYVPIALRATKLGEAWRFSPGLDITQKVLHLIGGFALAFRSPADIEKQNEKTGADDNPSPRLQRWNSSQVRMTPMPSIN